MHTIQSTSYFGARTVIAACALVALALACSAQAQDGCKMECYPNLKMINGKGGMAKSGDNCRWILRTDGKPARLCDHIKCRKVCPNAAAAHAQQDGSHETAAAASDNMRVEQQTDSESPAPATTGGEQQAMGAMRAMHGSKLAKAPVPGVAGGRLSSVPQQQQQQQPSSGRRSAPTLPPAVQDDENDTPPPIARFLDISPEE